MPTSLPQVTLKIYVASSLRTIFNDFARAFESSHGGTNIQLTFGSSSSLADKAAHGGDPDVLVLADSDGMSKAKANALVRDPAKFASNRLAIVVPAGNPTAIRDIDDLSRPNLRLAVCAPELSCGDALSVLTTAAGVKVKPTITESVAAHIVDDVADGKADAGLVYGTYADGREDKVTAVTFPKALLAVETYSIATTVGSRNPDRANFFVYFIKGDQAHRMLVDAGYGNP